MVDEVRTSPALTSQKYKANPVHVLWINSTATVQLKCYREFCEGCYGLSETFSMLNTQLSQLNDSSAPAQHFLRNFSPSSLTDCVLHSSLMASGSHSLLQKLLTTNFCGTFASCLQQPPGCNELFLLLSQIRTQAVCGRVSLPPNHCLIF